MAKIKKQNYLCVDLVARMQERDLREGEVRKGMLVMTHDQERFEFDEFERERWTRNPLVFQGEYINVHRDKNGHYVVALRKLELSTWCNVIRVGNAIITELLTAKKMLGVCRK